MDGERWLLAFRYVDMDTAKEPYETCRDLVFGLDIEASAYRLQVAGVVHVVVLGDGELLPPIRTMFVKACNDGEPVELADDLAEVLFERRATGKIPGTFWERRSI